jgi:protein-S-isoprenylcysteine O-methyltransferase Ste14
MHEETRDIPHVIAFPPLVYAGPLAIGLLLNAIWPLRFLPRLIAWLIGLPLFGSGLWVGAAAIAAMRRAGTDVNPNNPSTALVTDGPFGFSRNPIYLAFTLIYGGIAVGANALWAVLPLPIILTVMWRGVIEREERYLDRKFGDPYSQYKARVRRWL